MVTREAIIAAARSWRGTPYHHQASVKGVGSDCLGLIRGIWRELCGPEPEAVPAYTRDWGSATGSETLLAAACRHLVTLEDVSACAPGDVLVFRMRDEGVAKHVGIIVALPASGQLERGGRQVDSRARGAWRGRNRAWPLVAPAGRRCLQFSGLNDTAEKVPAAKPAKAK